MPASAVSSVRATSVPTSTLATHGRAEARIEYSFDGTLERARPCFSSTVWMSAAARTSGRRSLGCMPTKTTLSRPLARSTSSARVEPPPLTTNTTSGSLRRSTAASNSSSTDCEKPRFPAYMTTTRSPSPNSSR